MAAESGLGLSLGAVAEAEYLHGVESSTCLLLAASPCPTPTPPDACCQQAHPLASDPLFSADDPCTVHMHSEDMLADSSSSGDSGSGVLQQDPVSAQLINNISMLDYHTLSKVDHLVVGQDVECKLNGNVSLGNRKLPKFVNWNWNLVRKVLLWAVASSLIACVAIVVATVATLPKSCNPDLPWYQGTVFYEVFPASFQNSNNDAFGDLRGLIERLDYIEELGATAVRLNYIFRASEYPERYNDTADLVSVDPSIGTIKDFQDLVSEVHRRNMSILLDIPVAQLGASVSVAPAFDRSNHSGDAVTGTAAGSEDPLANALTFWSSTRRVDGFYLKGLEKFTAHQHFESNLRHWKRVIGYGKILMVSEETFLRSEGSARSVLLSKVDLIDVRLRPARLGGAEALRKRIREVTTGALSSALSRPWIHWNLGDVDSERLASAAPGDALALLTLELTLPGTIGLFYGDEIQLAGLAAVGEPDFHERDTVHNLVPMRWAGGAADAPRGGVLPWNSDSAARPEFAGAEVVRSLVRLRKRTPTLYLNSINKAGKWSANTQVRETEGQLVVVERWFPRRFSYVCVANLAPQPLAVDLSAHYYAGIVVASTGSTSATNASNAVGSYLYFDRITLASREAIVVKLEK